LASESSLQLLHYLVDHTIDNPILVIGTFRSEAIDQGHSLLKLQGQLHQDGIACVISLRDLLSEMLKPWWVKCPGRRCGRAPGAASLSGDRGQSFFLVETIKGLLKKDHSIGAGAWKVELEEISRGEFPLPES